jgi:Mg-chelatase subunit ChlD
MSKRKTIYNALPIVAAAYGEKFGVKISIGGDTACTDGKTINLPNIPEDYPHMDAVWGYLAHEAAHVRFTDFSTVMRPGLHGSLVNIIEDCRIEREMIKVYPGTAQTLNEVSRYMAQAGHYEHVGDDDHPASIIQGFSLYWLQSQVFSQDVLYPYLDTAKTALENVFPQGVVVRLNALLRKAVGIQSTQEASKLADEIIEMLKEEKDKEEQDQDGNQQGQDGNQQGQDGNQQGQADNQQSQDGNQQGQDGNQQGQGDNQQGQDGNQQGQDGNQQGQDGNQQGQDGNQQGQDGNQQGQDGNQHGQDGNRQGQGDNQQSQDGNQQGQGGKKKTKEVIAQTLNANDEDMLKDAHKSLKSDLDQFSVFNGDDSYSSVKEAEPAPKGDGTELLSSVKSTSAKIRSQLYGLVQSSQRVGSRNKRSGKRLDTNSLYRVMNGDTRVFRTPANKQRPNTAVHILVDMSGSMSKLSKTPEKRMYEVARESALSLSLALEPIQGVNPAVTYFMGHEEKPIYSVVKHGENVVNQAGKFMLRATGSTPMAEAIWYAAFELSKTREERKMIIVITDGEPNNPVSCKKVIDLCESSNVEMIGIGIEVPSVCRFFSNNILINDVNDLKKTLFKLMEKSLTSTAA